MRARGPAHARWFVLAALVASGPLVEGRAAAQGVDGDSPGPPPPPSPDAAPPNEAPPIEVTPAAVPDGPAANPALDEPTPMPVAFGADELRLDAHAQALDAAGHVRVDEPPFHLTSDELKLRRVAIGVELDGQGKLVFCPCLGAPLAVRFTGATVAPPHDLILRQPVLEVFGVPLAWAPVFWLRSSGRVGLLPPELAWRGPDGFFAGGGVHLPWRNGDTQHGADLRAGGYVDGGYAVEVAIRTSATSTRVRIDSLRGDAGVTIDARGATAIANGARGDSVAWDVNDLRGGRAVAATTDVDAAARPFDRSEAQAAWRPDGWVLAAGVRTVVLRGSDVLDLGAGGPVVSARRADALGSIGAYDATFEGGQISGAGLGPTSFGRGEGGGLLASRLGAFGASLALRGVGDLADDGARSIVDGTAQARATVVLPLSRAFASDDETDPWIHRTEPRVEAALLATHGDGGLVVPSGRGAVLPDDGAAWMAGAGWSNAFARVGSRAAGEMDVAAGAVGEANRTMLALRGRAAMSGPWIGLHVDFARVAQETVVQAIAQATTDPASTRPFGGAFVATARVGSVRGLSLAVHAAERDGIDPVVARALVDAPLEPSGGFLSKPGWTGGARVALPFGSRVTARGGADADLDAGALVAAVGAIELHDPCGCVVVRGSAAHRIGREGFDAWVSVDLPTSSP